MFSDSSNDPYRFASSYTNRRRKEHARRRRTIEEGRQRKAKIERRRRTEEEMACMREAEMWQKERGETKRGQWRLAQRRPSRKEAPSWQVVRRGPDGRLYRYDTIHTELSSHQITRGGDGRLCKVPYVVQDDIVVSQINYNLNADVSATEKKSKNDEECYFHGTSESTNDDDDKSAVSREWDGCRGIDDGPQTMATDVSLSAEDDALPREETIVEDVPGEEDEEIRELRSTWRNRVPSPGQWMEPVETYLKQ